MVGQELFAKSVEMKAVFLLSSHLILFLLSDWSCFSIGITMPAAGECFRFMCRHFLFLSLFMFVVYENGHSK